MQPKKLAGRPKKVSLASIASGVPAVKAKKSPDENDDKELEDLSNRKTLAEIGSIEQANRDKRAIMRLRFKYAKAVYRYLAWYTVGAGALVVFTGIPSSGFKISDIVLTTIVGSTAVAAIGLVGFVVNGLFKAH